VRACEELGQTDYPIIFRPGLSEDDKLDHVFKLNLVRRHLGPIAWAQLFTRLAEARGIPLGQPGRPLSAKNADTVSALSRELGVNPRTARRRLQAARELAPHGDLVTKVDALEMELKRALRVARTRRDQERLVISPSPVSTDGEIRLECCDFQELNISDDSVDLILTDPPYLKETANLLSDLSRFAARVLKPGGLLVSYSGHTTFPEAFDGLRAALEYVWVGALIGGIAWTDASGGFNLGPTGVPVRYLAADGNVALGGVSVRHSGGFNVAFEDGHVRWLRRTTADMWLADPRRIWTDPTLKYLQPYADNRP
jgi:prepilin-type processing-associated H-X9-DG protein